MPEIKLGPGLRILVSVLSIGLVAAVGFFSGTTYMKVEQGESNVDILSKDSEVAVKISKDTQERKNAINKWLKNNDPYDKYGNPTDEWLRLMADERLEAEQRGNQGSIIRKITGVQ